MKRKGSSGETAETKGTKRRRREKKSESDSLKSSNAKTDVSALKTKLDISSPLALLKSILSPHTTEFFESEHWEKKPLHIKRNDTDYYGNLFTMESLMDILEKHQLSYEVDLNACRYVDGEKEVMNGDDIAKAQEVRNLIEKQNTTVQFHQPQRFSDPLWKMMELLEKYFGSHVGANVYITPAGSQGLAPHNDDIEAFVMQLEGKKKWKLYKPLQELSREYSPDLTPAEIGEMTHEIELEPGDLLYFPRGIVHQAQTTSDDISTHITISTYQANTWGDFLLNGISSAIENALSKDVEFRRGLPLNYLSLLGTGKFIDEYVASSDEADEEKTENGNANGEETKSSKSPAKATNNTVDEFKTRIKDLLCRVVDHFDPNTVVDSRSEDFIANRLPPSEKMPDKDVGDQPTEKSSIKLLYPEHLRLVVYEEDDDDEFDADAEDESDDEDLIEDDEDVEEDEADEEEKEEKPKQKAKGKHGKTSKSKDITEKETSEDAEDEEMEEDDGEENILKGPHVRLLFSVHNPRETHMIGCIPEPNAVKLPLHFGKAISHLLKNSSEFIPLKDLPLAEESDKLELAITLWTEKLVNVQ